MVNGVSGTTGTLTTTHTNTTDTGSTSSNSDYLTFLRMLTTQVQNQDPLDPMDSSDFAAQLATFSGVEQQVQTNTLLTQLLQSVGGGQLGQYADWIGREVRISGPVWFDGEPVTLEISPDASADALTLVTLDSSGREVARESIGTGEGEVDWQGRDADGEPLPEGFYQFRLESLRDGEVIATTDVQAYSEVTGVESSAEGAVLVLRGNSGVFAADVTGVREGT